jgi:hypothetical protein
MDKAYINGRMEDIIRVCMLMINNMDMEYIYGPMEENIRENGRMES